MSQITKDTTSREEAFIVERDRRKYSEGDVRKIVELKMGWEGMKARYIPVLATPGEHNDVRHNTGAFIGPLIEYRNGMSRYGSMFEEELEGCDWLIGELESKFYVNTKV